MSAEITELRRHERKAPDDARLDAPSTDPMDCLNDVACTVQQVAAVIELAITSLETEPENVSDVVNALYGMRALLESAFARAAQARNDGGAA